MSRSKTLRRVSSRVLLAGISATSMLGVLGGVATATTDPGSMVSVPQGISVAATANATPIGTTAASTKLTVSFILKANQLDVLKADVSNGWRGSFLTVRQFASQFGQSHEYIRALVSYLASYGISSTVLPDMLDVTTTGTVSDYNNALAVMMQNFNVTAAASTQVAGKLTTKSQVVYATKRNPELPANLASNIVAVLGLQSYSPFVSQSFKALGPKSVSSAPGYTLPTGMRTPSDFVNQYNLEPLIQANNVGANQTIGIVTLASLNPKVPYTFWNKYLGLNVLANRIDLNNVDGGSGPVSLNLGSDETTLDVEQSGAIAPQARIIVYQAPNTDYGFVDAFFQAASANVADSLSASWGESETLIAESVAQGQESPGYAAAFDEAYLESAAQGQSVFVSSGDYAAYSAAGDLGTTNLSVDNPGDNAYVTSAGGTTLPGMQSFPVYNSSGATIGSESVTVPKEMTWNWGYLWPLYFALGFPSEASAAYSLPIGSGGGFSSMIPEPSYQQGVVNPNFSYHEYLTPGGYASIGSLNLPTTWTLTPDAKLATGTSTGSRAIPDLSVNADPETGYAVYDPQFTAAYGSPVLQFGGTSFSAPQLNGATAVINSYINHRAGFWNPQIYDFATLGHKSPFQPLDNSGNYGTSFYTKLGTTSIPSDAKFSNGNLYYTGTAKAIYNPGSGLGTPDLTALANAFGKANTP